jgi:hypothetical protein
MEYMKEPAIAFGVIAIILLFGLFCFLINRQRARNLHPEKDYYALHRMQANMMIKEIKETCYEEKKRCLDRPSVIQNIIITYRDDYSARYPSNGIISNLDVSKLREKIYRELTGED